jgi:hypothetical protein
LFWFGRDWILPFSTLQNVITFASNLLYLFPGKKTAPPVASARLERQRGSGALRQNEHNKLLPPAQINRLPRAEFVSSTGAKKQMHLSEIQL